MPACVCGEHNLSMQVDITARSVLEGRFLTALTEAFQPYPS